MFIKIILGLIGLGIVVFIHEFGHFLGARIMKIEVEAFSLGWGKAFLKKKIGRTEYRLSVFPVGGYCKMKGENDGQHVMEPDFKPEPGSLFSVHPLKRAFMAFAGPFFNLLFAVAVFSIIWGIGFETPTLENRIVLVSDISGDSSYPANAAGLQTGDRIVSINGKTCENYSDVQQIIALNPNKALQVTAIRGRELIELSVTPSLDKSSGAGKIGVYFWTDPVIEKITENSPAEKAGLKPGDIITTFDGEPFPYTAALFKILKNSENAGQVNIAWTRGGAVHEGTLDLSETQNLGIEWRLPVYKTPRYNLAGAVAKGVDETWTTFTASVRSLTLFFKGIDLTQAVSGPIRITYMTGEIAASGFAESASSGFRASAEFLAFISIALCVMNLLPLPILDGGLIVLYIIETIRRRPAPPKALAAFQAAGIVLIAGLMIFAMFGDIMFLVKQ